MSQQNSVTSDDFSKRLSLAIDRSPYNASTLGKITGVDRAYISMLRRGKRENPSDEVVANLAAALKVSVDWLTTGEGPMVDYSPTVKEHLEQAVQTHDWSKAAQTILPTWQPGQLLQGIENLIARGKAHDQDPQKTLHEISVALKMSGYL